MVHFSRNNQLYVAAAMVVIFPEK